MAKVPGAFSRWPRFRFPVYMAGGDPLSQDTPRGPYCASGLETSRDTEMVRWQPMRESCTVRGAGTQTHWGKTVPLHIYGVGGQCCGTCPRVSSILGGTLGHLEEVTANHLFR